MFKGRNLVIATKHHKETVIAPILNKELGVSCLTADRLDTDLLGTFSGEIERKLDPIANAREKCIRAMDMYNCDLAVASEGSFGPHPSLYFIPADDEFIVLVDRKNNLEIVARELSPNTNFNGDEIKNKFDLDTFLTKARFPTHAVILKNSKDDHTNCIKGITQWTDLEMYSEQFFKSNQSFFIETDMRAMYNPSRMEVIKQATLKLISKLNSSCPNCDLPGFDVVDTRKGLPCSQCGMPTKSTSALIYRCKKCSFEQEKLYPNNKKHEEPMYCDFCNP